METIKEKANEYADSIIASFGINRVPKKVSDIKDIIAEAYIKALSSQWRNIDEKPRDEERVLIYERYRSAKSGRYVNHIIEYTYFDDYGFEQEEQSNRSLNLKVLAWMPIPNLK